MNESFRVGGQEYAVIVHPAKRGYVARVVQGTIQRYYPQGVAEFRRRTPERAKRAGERHIRVLQRNLERKQRREARARRITGYSS